MLREAEALAGAGAQVHVVGRGVPEQITPPRGVTVASVGRSAGLRPAGRPAGGGRCAGPGQGGCGRRRPLAAPAGAPRPGRGRLARGGRRPGPLLDRGARRAGRRARARLQHPGAGRRRGRAHGGSARLRHPRVVERPAAPGPARHRRPTAGRSRSSASSAAGPTSCSRSARRSRAGFAAGAGPAWSSSATPSPGRRSRRCAARRPRGCCTPAASERAATCPPCSPRRARCASCGGG